MTIPRGLLWQMRAALRTESLYTYFPKQHLTLYPHLDVKGTDFLERSGSICPGM